MYSANITGGGLLLPESRVFAGQLLAGVPMRELPGKILAENLLQKRSPVTTRTITRLLVARLSLLSPEYLHIVANGSKDEASLLLLAAIAEAHRLIGDFLLFIGRECLGQYKKDVTFKDWSVFFEQCVAFQPGVARWSPTTVAKIRSIVFKTLVDSGILKQKTYMLVPLFLPQSVCHYLALPQKKYARICLECLQ